MQLPPSREASAKSSDSEPFSRDDAGPEFEPLVRFGIVINRQ
jgi:hypothetical protein